MMAWDGKGNSLAVVYNEQGKTSCLYMIFDKADKTNKQELPDFDQIQDMKYMPDGNTLLLSAVKNGQSDIFTYKIERINH